MSAQDYENTIARLDDQIEELEAKLQGLREAGWAVVKSHELYDLRNVVGAKPLDNLRKALENTQ